jgi:hypothetical protein
MDVPVFFGLIYPCSSGVIWTNQTGAHFVQFGEAWIPVIVQEFSDDPLKPLANKLVILTYENSD